jgi:aerobic C4-dicarboxylate transport protein
VVVSRWESALDHERLDAALNGRAVPVVVAGPAGAPEVPAGVMARTAA